MTPTDPFDKVAEWFLDDRRLARMILICYAVLVVGLVLYVTVGAPIALFAAPGACVYLGGWYLYLNTSPEGRSFQDQITSYFEQRKKK